MNDWAVKRLNPGDEEVQDKLHKLLMSSRAHRLFGGHYRSVIDSHISKTQKFSFSDRQIPMHGKTTVQEQLNENAEGLGKRSPQRIYQPSLALEFGLSCLSDTNHELSITKVFEDGCSPESKTISFPWLDAKNKRTTSINKIAKYCVSRIHGNQNWQADIGKTINFDLNSRENSAWPSAISGPQVLPNTVDNGPKIPPDEQYFNPMRRVKTRSQLKVDNLLVNQTAFDRYKPKDNQDDRLLLSCYDSVAISGTTAPNLALANDIPSMLSQENAKNLTENTDLFFETEQLKSDAALMLSKKLKLKRSLNLRKDSLEPMALALSRILDKQSIEISQVRNLSPYELLFFRALAQKIFRLVESEKLSTLEFISEVNRNLHGGKPKRAEENYKFIFKKCIKHLMNLLKEYLTIDLNGRQQKADLAFLFYNRYFYDLVQSSPKFRAIFSIEFPDGSIDLDSLNSQLIHPSTVTAAYLAAVSQSSNFKKDTLAYLDHGLLADYCDARMGKIKRILVNFYGLAAGEASPSDVEQFVMTHQLKLPWSTRDVTTAIASFRAAIEGSCFFN